MFTEPWDIFSGFIVLSVAGLFIILGWALFDAAIAPTFALRKDSWSCTQTHAELVGRVYQDVCDNWRSNYAAR